MKHDHLQPYEGQVVCLDLINGTQITTTLQEVDKETEQAVCLNPRVFAVVTEAKNPNFPPSESNPPEMKVKNFPYGHPLYETTREVRIDLNHILMVLKPTSPEDHIQAYKKDSTSIETAPANVLDQLEGLDLSNLGN